MRPLPLAVLALVLALTAPALIGACASSDCEDLGTCPPRDAGAPSNACQGTCLPSPPSFGGPYVVWMGETAPPSDPCARPLLQDFFEGTAAPPPLVCGECACSTPSGSCALPATATVGASCSGSGASTTFELPSGWNGSCATFLPFESVESVTVAPLVLEEGCSPHVVMDTKPPPPPPPPQAWPYVNACQESVTGTCSNDGDVCAPALASSQPSAFVWTYCVSMEEPAQSCPSAYPIQRDFGNGWPDAPTCMPCTCSAPVGSSCSPSTITAYSDAACTDAVGAVEAQASTSSCAPLSTASSLGSMSATPSMYAPGTCTPSGGITGGPPTPAVAMTFCCQE
jgi:hypothetical protein